MYYKLCPSPKITPTIRCCSQHLMVGVNFFFLTSSPILDLGHFSQVILPIVLQAICPTIRCCSQHLMVGVIFFFDLFSHSGLRPFFTSDFTNCTTGYMPNHQVPWYSTWWLGLQHLFFFFFTSSPILDLEHFSQVILPIVLQIMPLPKNNNNHQVLFTASDGWVDFFLTFSPILDLAHFSQVILPIVLQAICPTIRCCSQHLMVGVNFFLTSSPILDLGHFSQVILPILLQIMPPPKNNPNHKVL